MPRPPSRSTRPGRPNERGGERSGDRSNERAGERQADRGARPDGGAPGRAGERGARPDATAPGRGGERVHARGGRSASAAGEPWVYGTHAVAAALANPARRIRRILLTEEAEAAIGRVVPRPWAVGPERIDRARLDLMLGRDAVHQGAAVLADPLTPPTLEEALARPGPVLVLDQVTDPRNIGAILRSAAAFGAAAVVVQDRHTPDEAGVLAKAASGALEVVPLLRAVNLARTLAALKHAGLWVVGMDAGGGVLRASDFGQRRVALVLGAEGGGLRRLTRESCDEICGLHMPGGMESLNVSVAAAVALYEFARQ